MTDTETSKNSFPAIAVIGMGCIFPNSRNLKEYWRLLLNGQDAIQEIPQDTHWRVRDYFDPDPARPDHTYCSRGGFLPEIFFDPLSYGMPPKNIEATDTSQLLGLEVAKMALSDAGYPQGHPYLSARKVNVILGVTGTQELVIPLGARLGHPIWKKALRKAGVDAGTSNEVLERISADYVQWQENSFPGLLGNVVAGRIANRLDLSGTNSVSDAACASSLSALHTAIMELATGKCDMSITGGVDTLNDIFMHMCFSKTGVLSHTSDARPFSKDADGTVLGEGIGMVILKRLEDAQKDNDRIYAVIKGVGTSSDGRTSAIYAPESKGQLKALKDAYTSAGVDPGTVEMIEAHGTGTRVGDKVEFDALKMYFDPHTQKNRIAIGSVKSMIGHTKAAAGAAGIIKAVLALHNKVLLPTLKAKTPDPDLDINQSGFYLNQQSKPWVSWSSTNPRRSGVSAFGFGGSNFHAVLEEYQPDKTHVSWDGSIQIIAFSENNSQKMIKRIRAFSADLQKNTKNIGTGPVLAYFAQESRKQFQHTSKHRLLIVHREEDDIFQTLESAEECVDKQSCRDNIYYASNTPGGKLGFLFPGQGSQYPGMGADLLCVFPEAVSALNQADSAFNRVSDHPDERLHDVIFSPPEHIRSKKKSEQVLRDTALAQPSIGAVSLGMLNVLKRFSVRCDMACGHSFGELSALCAAGWITPDDFYTLAAQRGRLMAQAGKKKGDPGSMLAVQADLDVIDALIRDEGLNLVFANRNSTTQGVLSGSSDEIARAKKICRKKKIRAIALPVAAAFHSSHVMDAAEPFLQEVEGVAFSPTDTDVLSNTTGSIYDRDETGIRELLGNQLARPVDFVKNIRTMQQKGVRLFVEVGPRAVLSGLVRSMTDQDPVRVAAMDDPAKKRSGMENLAHVLCEIAAQGAFVDLTAWEDPVEKPAASKLAIPLTGANIKPRPDDRKKPIPETNDLADPLKTVEKPENKKSGPPSTSRSDTEGSGMTTQRNNIQTQMSIQAAEAMQLVSKGLEAMQKLQEQTAKAHEKFLDTQAQAGRTLANMLEQTRNLAAGVPATDYSTASNTIPASPKASEVPAGNDRKDIQPAAAPLKKAHHIENQETQKVEEKKSDGAPKKRDRAEAEENIEVTGSGVQQILFDIVSELTGFPVEMLEPSMDIESDLGIDSIKKVEIVSELEKKLPDAQGLSPENIGSVRTLEDICAAIEGEGYNASPQKIDTPSEAQTETRQDVDIPTGSKGLDQQKIISVLVETISELTGFPVEMLEPSMNLESDLGIDSIKRVEILSRLEQELDDLDPISPDDIAKLATIEEIVEHIAESESQDTDSKKKRFAKRIKKKRRKHPLNN